MSQTLFIHTVHVSMYVYIYIIHTVAKCTQFKDTQHLRNVQVVRRCKCADQCHRGCQRGGEGSDRGIWSRLGYIHLFHTLQRNICPPAMIGRGLRKCLFISTCIHTHAHTCTHMNTHTNMYVYVYMYTHTQTH